MTDGFRDVRIRLTYLYHPHMPSLFPLCTKFLGHNIQIESIPLFTLLDEYIVNAPYFFIIEFLAKVTGLVVKLQMNFVSGFELS